MKTKVLQTLSLKPRKGKCSATSTTPRTSPSPTTKYRKTTTMWSTALATTPTTWTAYKITAWWMIIGLLTNCKSRRSTLSSHDPLTGEFPRARSTRIRWTLRIGLRRRKEMTSRCRETARPNKPTFSTAAASKAPPITRERWTSPRKRYPRWWVTPTSTSKT